MATTSNPIAGSTVSSSAESIYQERLVIRAGAILFSDQFSDTPMSARLAVDNLPNLQWYLYLEPTYLLPSTGVVHVAQPDISWRPIVQLARTSGVNSPMGLPFSAPALLPIGVPVRLNIRAAVGSIGIELNVPPTQQTFNSIHFILSASQ